MLAPDTRVLLTDALRPPDGYHLDVAVGTTFSLDLTALLLAPLSFAFMDGDTDITHTDPAALLAAIRQYSARTTVFCQAGAIAVPPAYRRVLTFAEGSVHEVVAPQEGRLFHPKIWALRFVDDSSTLHRLVVLSRNLTFDRSWDTVLVLDEGPEGSAVDAARAADFVAALPGMCLRPLPEERAEQVASVAATLRAARLVVPAPFDSAELLPLGLDQANPSPVPPSTDRMLVISPFLDAGSVRLASGVSDRTLVSRPESFTHLGGQALTGWTTSVLSRFAETADDGASGSGEEDDLPLEAGAPVGHGRLRVAAGLHAKIVVADVGRRAHVVTGSANFTTAGWGGNVEFSVRLEGPVARCGVAAVLGSGPGSLAALLDEFLPTDEAPEVDPREITEQVLEDYHRALAESGARVVVGDVDEDTTSMDVSFDLAATPPGETRVWPITLRPDSGSKPMAAHLSWQPVALSAVTPFVAVETTAGSGHARVTRRCVVKAELIGDPPERHTEALRAMLADVEAVVRYLAMLLAEPDMGAASVFATVTAADSLVGGSWGSAAHDIVLFEPLVRAAVRDPGAVGRIAGMVDELRTAGDLLPPSFDELWDVVQEFIREETEV